MSELEYLGNLLVSLKGMSSNEVADCTDYYGVADQVF